MSVTIEVAGERLTLLPGRGLYWAAADTLLIADVHLGKAAAFRHHAIPVPDGADEADLGRLSALLHQSGAKRLIILGDWLHAPQSHTPDTLQRVEAWRAQHPALEVWLIPGNHDRHVITPTPATTLPPDWNIVIQPSPCLLPPFVLQHHPRPTPDGYVLAGHLHPGVEIRGKGRQLLRLPCFHVGANILTLPAFGSFTGLALIQPQAAERVFAVTDEAVIPLPRSRDHLSMEA